jgi:serine/threonine protein kinase
VTGADAPPTLERYELFEPLSRGGFGAVYRGRHRVTKRMVAIKVLRERALDLGQGGEDLVREARALAAVDHPNVVGVLDCGVEDGRAFVVMELMTGETLSSRIEERGTLRLGEVLPTVLQVLEGLRAVHEVGIVHRDVKPGNVMIDRRGTAKLVDFGLSSSASGVASWEAGRPSAPGAGTPGYMAPEQYDAEAVLDARADLYAVGATLFRALTGRAPFVGSTEEIRARVTTVAAPPIGSLVPGLPAHVAAAIDRSLARDRDARPASAVELAAALRGSGTKEEGSTLPALSTPSGEARPEQGASPRPDRARRSGVVAASGLLVAGGLAALVWGSARSSAVSGGAATSAPSGPVALATVDSRAPSVAPEDDAASSNEAPREGGTEIATPPSASAAPRAAPSAPATSARVLTLTGHALDPFGGAHAPARAAFVAAMPKLRGCAKLACLGVDKVVRADPFASLEVVYTADAEGHVTFAGVRGALPRGNPCPAFEACISAAARDVVLPKAERQGTCAFHLRVTEAHP